METQFTTANGQSFGVQGFSNASAPALVNPNAVSPNSIRWQFNPYAYINVSERPISGHHQLKAGVFIPITSQTDRISISGIATSPGKAFDWQSGNSPQASGLADPGAPQGPYRNEVRSAYAIADELEAAYTDKGLRTLPSLTGIEDIELVRMLHQVLVADGLSFNPDPYQPDFPVPNLVVLESYLANEAMKTAHTLTSEGVKPIDVVKDILVAVRTAIQNCRSVTRDAKRVVANKTVGHVHVFDAYATRCFIALGEETPSDLGEMYGKTAATMPVDMSELSRLRAENEQLRLEAANKEIAALREENDRLRATTSGPATETATDIARCDYVKDGGVPCKGSPVTGGTRCRHHIENKEIENVEEN